MSGKIIIKCKIRVLTGLHIGSSDAYAAIGAADSPVVRNQRTGNPVIPGSSVKGKVRTLLAKSHALNSEELPDFANDDPVIIRMFGSAGNRDNGPVFARLKFSDADVSKQFLAENPEKLTEVKAENTIDRLSSIANPRFIERVIPGVVFDMVITYDESNLAETVEDMKMLAKGLKLLELDTIGGHGSRGYGRVSLDDFDIELFESDANPEELKKIFEPVKNYELFNF